jgi:hypothetical protein
MSKMDALLPRLKGKVLEISIGDEYEELTLNDHIKKVNGIIYGILEDVVDDFLVVSCYYFDKNGALHKRGNVVYINTWSVKVFTELNSRGCLNDVFLSSEHSRKMKALLGIDD